MLLTFFHFFLKVSFLKMFSKIDFVVPFSNALYNQRLCSMNAYLKISLILSLEILENFNLVCTDVFRKYMWVDHCSSPNNSSSSHKTQTQISYVSLFYCANASLAENCWTVWMGACVSIFFILWFHLVELEEIMCCCNLFQDRTTVERKWRGWWIKMI